MKRHLLLLVSLLTGFTCLSAQSTLQTYPPYDDAPYYYLGVKGGVQGICTNYDFTQLLEPAVGIDLGMQFNRIIGGRLSWQGLWAKTAFRSADETMRYNYWTADADLILNVTNIFSRIEQWVDFSLVYGAGFNYSWNASEAADYPFADRSVHAHESLKSHNVRLGAILGGNINRHWRIELECDANNLKDLHNSKLSQRTDWQLCALLGVQYRWGHNGSAAPARTQAQPVERCKTCGLSLDQCLYGGNHPQVVNEPLPAVDYKQAEDIHIEVFFDLDNASIRPGEDAKLRGLSNFVRTHRFGTVMVNAYADRDTGNPTYNQALSERRAATIVDALISTYQIPADRIESRAFGDKVQPFAENDLNRVVIIDIKEVEKK